MLHATLFLFGDPGCGCHSITSLPFTMGNARNGITRLNRTRSVTVAYSQDLHYHTAWMIAPRLHRYRAEWIT